MTVSASDIPAYLEPVIGFRSRKAVQLCAWFAIQNAGTIEKLKLIKLIYLTEREHLSMYEDSMLFDELYSLPHGPICSGTLNGIDGRIHAEIWDSFIARNGNIVVAMRTFARSDLDDLSDNELQLAQKVWSQFCGMSASQIRNYTHDNCPEYTEISSGRIPIKFEDVLRAVGSDNARFVESEIASLRREEMVLSQAS